MISRTQRREIPLSEHQAIALREMRRYLQPKDLKDKFGAAETLSTNAVSSGVKGEFAKLAVYGAAAHESGVVTARELVDRVADRYVEEELENDTTLATINKIRRGRENQNIRIFTLGEKLPGITVDYLDKFGVDFAKSTIAEQLIQLQETNPDLHALFNPQAMTTKEERMATHQDIGELKLQTFHNRDACCFTGS